MPKCTVDSPAFAIEHSWCVDLPILQLVAEDVGRTVRVVPILTGAMRAIDGVRFGQQLARLCFEHGTNALVVASGDMTHVGRGYSPAPHRLTAGPLVDVVAQLDASEARARESLMRADAATFADEVATTTFCARAQVAAALSFAGDEGLPAGACTVVNGRRVGARGRRTFDPARDALFRGMSTVFPLAGGEPSFPKAKMTLTSDLVAARDDDAVSLWSRTVGRAIELPAESWPILKLLWRGVRDVAQIAHALGIDDPDDRLELERFVGHLAEQGFIGTGNKLDDRAARRAQMLDAATASVPAYSVGGALSARPVTTSKDIQRDWNAFGIGGRPLARNDALFHRRRSSGSTSKTGLVTVVERDVHEQRASVEHLVTGFSPAARVVAINRNSNLFAQPKDGFQSECVEGRILHVSPGLNPTRVAPRVWGRVMRAIDAHDVEILEGEPTYLVAFARRAQAAGLILPRLKAVVSGHTRLWSFQRTALEDALGVPVHVRLFSSELHTMAIECALGNLHLLECHTEYEVVGRRARAAKQGVLLATTLDTAVRPLVRYATGDVVRRVAESCACGRPFATIEHLGRVSEFVQVGARTRVGPIEIDRVLAALHGVDAIRLRVTKDRAQLALLPTAEGFVPQRPRADTARRLGQLLKRPVTVALRDSFAVPARKKHTSLVVTPKFDLGDFL